MEADSALNAQARPFIPGSTPAFGVPILAAPSLRLVKSVKKTQRPLATIPEQEIAINTPTITPIKSTDECDEISEDANLETNKNDASKQGPQPFSQNGDGLSQMSTWNNHCLYLGMCGVDPQSMVPKGLITKLEDAKLKGVSNVNGDAGVFADLMSQLPSLRCGTSNLPEALAEMNNLVTPIEGVSWNWNANVNSKTTNNNTTSNNHGDGHGQSHGQGHSHKVKKPYTNAKDPVEQIGGSLDQLTWDNMEHSVLECSVAPIYHPQTLYQAAQRVHRSVVRKKCNLRLCCDFLVQLSNNWPSFSFGPSDKGFETLCSRLVNDMKHKVGRSNRTANINLNLNLSELSLESIGSETQSLGNGDVVEKKNVSLATLCTQLSLGFVLYSNQSGKTFAHWLRDMVTNLTFLMELYLCRCLDFNRIHLVMVSLMDKNEEWSWRVLCETLTLYGQRLEQTQGPLIQMYFDRMHLRCETKQYPSNELCVQAILREAIDFRTNDWQKEEKLLPNKSYAAINQENVENNVNKSYASLLKSPLYNSSKKRLHVVANVNGKKPTQSLSKNEDKKNSRAVNDVAAPTNNSIDSSVTEEARSE